jgi:hypothetical protein
VNNVEWYKVTKKIIKRMVSVPAVVYEGMGE